MKVKYTGTSNFQVFGKADFEKAGVEQDKLSFAKNKAVEVPDAIGQALVSKEGIFGSFSFEETEDEPETPSKSSGDDDQLSLPVSENNDPPAPNTKSKK